jgi:hypothetical protein
MTKSTGVGRGGARPNSGPKKKPIAGPTQVAGAANATPIIPVGLSDEERDKFIAGLCRETLATIMVHGKSESARVAASRELLDRSLGKPKPAPATKPDQSDFFEDGWGDLLKSRQPATRRTN